MAAILEQLAKENERAAISSAIDRQIENQFSSWDGSHRKVERAIKENMNDPDSYKHVSTTYQRTNTGLVVLTTYRGKNAFGGVVTGTARAITDENGNVVSLKSIR